MRRLFTLMLLPVLGCLPACQDDLPPLIRGATTGVGGIAYDCGRDAIPLSESTLSRSPEITERLSQTFPPRSSSANLRSSLKEQGFEMMGPCSVDGSVSWAQFRKNGNEVVANIYWREDSSGRLVWTFGNVYFTFL